MCFLVAVQRENAIVTASVYIVRAKAYGKLGVPLADNNTTFLLRASDHGTESLALPPVSGVQTNPRLRHELQGVGRCQDASSKLADGAYEVDPPTRSIEYRMSL